jgi:hypothetical protein
VNDWPVTDQLERAERLVEIDNLDGQGEELSIDQATVSSGMRGSATYWDWPTTEEVRSGSAELPVIADGPCGIDGPGPTLV